MLESLYNNIRFNSNIFLRKAAAVCFRPDFQNQNVFRFGRYLYPLASVQVFDPDDGFPVGQKRDPVSLRPGDLAVDEQLFDFPGSFCPKRLKPIAIPAVPDHQRLPDFVPVEIKREAVF